MTPLRRFFLFAAVCGLLFPALGCGQKAEVVPPVPLDPDAPLPAETDLHAYAVAVARRTRARIPGSDARTLYLEGKVEERFGFEDRALELYAQAIELDSQLAEAHRSVGFILSQRSGRMDEAIDAYQKSLLSNPTQPGVYTRIGLILTHQGKLPEALRAFEQEIAGGGADAVTYYNLGHAKKLQSDHAAAVSHFRKALELDPSMREAHYNLAGSLRALGRTEEADAAQARFDAIRKEWEDKVDLKTSNEEDLRKFTALAWMDAATAYLGEAQMAAVRPDGARARAQFEAQAAEAAREAIRFDPTIADAQLFLLNYSHASGDPEIREVASAAVEALPEHPQVLFQVGTLYMSLAPKGDPTQPPPLVDEAVDLFERGLRIASDSADLHRELAKALLFRKRQPEWIAKAETHARRALDLTTKPEPLHFDLLAMAYAFTGRVSEATSALRDGVERFPEDPGLKARLAKLEERQRQGVGR